MTYDGDIDKSLITDEYLPAWEKFGLFSLKAKNTEETVRAYSMANYPEEGDRIMLTVRIATPLQAKTTGRLPGRAVRHSIILYLLSETWRQGDDEWSLRRLPSYRRLQG